MDFTYWSALSWLAFPEAITIWRKMRIDFGSIAVFIILLDKLQGGRNIKLCCSAAINAA
jgi:hypothetical protein